MGHGSTCQCASADGKIGQLSLSRFTCLHVFFSEPVHIICHNVDLPARVLDDHAHFILHNFVCLRVILTIMRMTYASYSTLSSSCT